VTVSLETRVRPAADVLFRQLGGEAVLLNLATGSYFGLNEVGARIWALLAGGATLAASLAILSAEYDASAEQLRIDLLALVEELVGNGLLVVEPA
jgi:hypothetical protein